MIRQPGLYAVVDGEQVLATLHGTDHVYLPAHAGRVGSVRRDIADLDDFLSVKTTAMWRGGKIAVNAVAGDECGFFTSDKALAEREGLAGDFYNGWRGAAKFSDLTHVEERVTSLHPRSREER